MRERRCVDFMIGLEIKKNIKSIYFVISVVLLYIMFLLGDSGQVLRGETSTTIIQAIWSKFHGNWCKGVSSSYLVCMNNMWTGNEYLPILMPIICGFPSVANYLEEIVTKNKRMIFSRCNFREYYVAKIVANVATAIVVSVTAIILFYITLMIGYDNIPITDESFPIIYFIFSGKMIDEIEGVQQISMPLIYMQLFKGILFFSLYSVINSSFCFFVSVLLQDKYMVLGGTIAVSYLQCRIYGELCRKYLKEGDVFVGRISDLLNPCFLHCAGSATSGFYQHKTWLALMVAFIMISFNFWLAIYVSRKKIDITER